MNNKLKIISDTGDEGSFQVTEIHNEQFAEISNTIQKNYDFILSKINNEFQILYEILKEKECIIDNKFNEYNLKIIDLIYNAQKEIDNNISNYKILLNEQIDIIQAEYNSKHNYLKRELSDLQFNHESQRINNICSLDKLFAIYADHNQVINENKSLIKTLEDKNLERKDETILLRTFLQDEISYLKNQILLQDVDISALKKSTQFLDETKVSIKLPWYKRIFSK